LTTLLNGWITPTQDRAWEPSMSFIRLPPEGPGAAAAGAAAAAAAAAAGASARTAPHDSAGAGACSALRFLPVMLGATRLLWGTCSVVAGGRVP
jgi:hypothetical protein